MVVEPGRESVEGLKTGDAVIKVGIAGKALSSKAGLLFTSEMVSFDPTAGVIEPSPPETLSFLGLDEQFSGSLSFRFGLSPDAGPANFKISNYVRVISS